MSNDRSFLSPTQREFDRVPLTGEGITHQRYRMTWTTVLLAALAVSSPSVAAGGPSAATVSESPAPALELLGRWHGGPVYSSAVSGDHVYFGTGGSIRVLRIEPASGEHASWKEVASIGTSGIVRGLDAFGNHLYVADDSGALRIIDISAPEKPKEVRHVEVPAFVRAVSVKGQYAYLAAGWSGLVIIDVADPKRPRVVQEHKTPDLATGVHVTGSLVLVTNRTRGVRLIDISSPLQPKEVGHYEIPGFAYDVSTSNNTTVRLMSGGRPATDCRSAG